MPVSQKSVNKVKAIDGLLNGPNGGLSDGFMPNPDQMDKVFGDAKTALEKDKSPEAKALLKKVDDAHAYALTNEFADAVHSGQVDSFDLDHWAAKGAAYKANAEVKKVESQPQKSEAPGDQIPMGDESVKDKLGALPPSEPQNPEDIQKFIEGVNGALAGTGYQVLPKNGSALGGYDVVKDGKKVSSHHFAHGDDGVLDALIKSAGVGEAGPAVKVEQGGPITQKDVDGISQKGVSSHDIDAINKELGDSIPGVSLHKTGTGGYEILHNGTSLGVVGSLKEMADKNAWLTQADKLPAFSAALAKEGAGSQLSPLASPSFTDAGVSSKTKQLVGTEQSKIDSMLSSGQLPNLNQFHHALYHLDNDGSAGAKALAEKWKTAQKYLTSPEGEAAVKNGKIKSFDQVLAQSGSPAPSSDPLGHISDILPNSKETWNIAADSALGQAGLHTAESKNFLQKEAEFKAEHGYGKYKAMKEAHKGLTKGQHDAIKSHLAPLLSYNTSNFLKTVDKWKTSPGNYAEQAHDEYQNLSDAEKKSIPNLPAGMKPTMQGAAQMKVVKAKEAQAQATQAIAAHSSGDFVKAGQKLDGFTKSKALGGSSDASLYTTPGGHQVVAKSGSSPEHAQAEVDANRIYEALGVNVPKTAMMDVDGKQKIVSQFINGETLDQAWSKADAGEKEKISDAIKSHFVADALLGNWDVIGTDAKNTMVAKTGGGNITDAFRIDNGGALDYRAMGDKKTLGPKVAELDSMRSSKMSANPIQHEIFSQLTDKEINQQISSILKKKDAVLAATPERLKGVMAQRLDDLQSRLNESQKASGIASLAGKPQAEVKAAAKSFSGTANAVSKAQATNIIQHADHSLNQTEFKNVAKTSSHYSTLNAFTGGSYSEFNTNPHSEKSKKLVEAVNSLAPVKTALVSRGQSFYASELPKYLANYYDSEGKPKTYAQEYTLSSWSKAANPAFSGNVILTVKNPKSAKDIQFLSKFPNEQEAVFTKGTKFRPTGPPVIKGGTYHIELEEV